jgi:hypothetical protein
VKTRRVTLSVPKVMPIQIWNFIFKKQTKTNQVLKRKTKNNAVSMSCLPPSRRSSNRSEEGEDWRPRRLKIEKIKFQKDSMFRWKTNKKHRPPSLANRRFIVSFLKNNNNNWLIIFFLS